MSSENNAWFIDISEEKLDTEFNETNASLIVDVARNSPASHLGLETGDYIVSVDGLYASAIDLEGRLLDGRENIEYQFYSYSKHININVSATTVPLGIVTEASSIGIVERYRSEGFYGWGDLMVLWKRQNWNALEEASELVSSNGVISRFRRVFNKNFGISAEILFKGAAIYERGEREKGIDLIGRFIDDDLHNHETSLHAIAYLYAAKWAELNDDGDACRHWLAEANRSNGGHFERIVQEVYFKGYEAPADRYSWKGKTFPELYTLLKLGESEAVSLQETLGSMSADQLLPVCVMPTYRGNGPYNEAMRCYRAIYKYVSHRVQPMQVILDSTEKRTDRDFWYENEELAINSGIPINLLHDKEQTVANKLKLEFSPVFYLLTNKGKIHYEGPLNRAYDYWDAISNSQP
jgi:hypothetical protein